VALRRGRPAFVSGKTRRQFADAALALRFARFAGEIQ